MADTLKTLIRVAKWEVDERQRALNDLLRFEEEIKNAKAKLLEEKIAQDKAVSEFFDLYFSYDAYLEKYIEKQKNLDNVLLETRVLIEKAREMLQDSFITLKTYEVSASNKKKQEDYEQDLKIGKDLDEMGLNSYRLKNKKD